MEASFLGGNYKYGGGIWRNPRNGPGSLKKNHHVSPWSTRRFSLEASRSLTEYLERVPDVTGDMCLVITATTPGGTCYQPVSFSIKNIGSTALTDG